MNEIVFITGLAASGKTTLAKQKAAKRDASLISLDDHIFGENWQRRSYAAYRASVMHDLINANNDVAVVEGVCYNSTDDQDQRAKVATDLLNFGSVKQVIIFRPTNIYDHVARIIDRSIRRANGLESGTCVETSINRARMVVKAVRQYEDACQQLEKFADECVAHNVPVCWKEMFTPTQET